MLSHRREFLQTSAAVVSALALPHFARQAIAADGLVASEQHFEVVDVQRTTVKLEYRPVPRRNMDRELPHWRYTEFCDVKLKSNVTGTGETLLYYTWGVPTDQAIQSVIGKSALEVMWDDNLGAGLQMALFDAVGRTAGVPVHALLGNKVHNTTPLSWWNIDTSAEDMASECATAYKAGYMSYKTKGRPWFDVDRQMALATQAVPERFKIDMDFNSTLLTAEQGLPILKRLAKYPQTDIYESPIPQSDIEGNRAIVDATHVNVAMHYGSPTPRDVARTGCCDGFVVGRGASALMGAGHFCEQVEMPFWLQLVGSGLTAAWSLQFGGVLEQSRWPAVNCHQLYQTDLLTAPITLQKGMAKVPDRPGIGFEINRDEVAKLKVKRPASRPEPPRLLETTWADGSRMYTASNGKVNFMLDAANAGKYPFYKKGAHTQLIPNDGTERWQTLYQRARQEGPIQA